MVITPCSSLCPDTTNLFQEGRPWEKACKSHCPIHIKSKSMWLRTSWHSNRHAPQNTKERKMRSKIRWFTEFCNSHYLSHFAAFFIDARAKRSVAESCMYFYNIKFDIPKQHSRDCKRNMDLESSPSIKEPKNSRPTVGAQRRNEIKMTGVHVPREASNNPLKFYSIMILPQVHLRKPCYDFYFL